MSLSLSPPICYVLECIKYKTKCIRLCFIWLNASSWVEVLGPYDFRRMPFSFYFRMWWIFLILTSDKKKHLCLNWASLDLYIGLVSFMPSMQYTQLPIFTVLDAKHSAKTCKWNVGVEFWESHCILTAGHSIELGHLSAFLLKPELCL